MSRHTPILPADRPARMRERVALFDWAATSAGPLEAWSEPLRTATDLCLASPLPAILYIGVERIALFNDAWQEQVGADLGLGQSAADPASPLWAFTAPLVAEAERTGEGAFVRERPLTLTRDGQEEESWWNSHLVPIRGPGGEALAFFNQINDVTRAVLAERRLSFQVALADALRGAGDAEAVKNNATRLLGEYLGAARVGYAEVDEERGETWVRSDWTADRDGQSLAGQRIDLKALGEEALAYLRTGEVLVLSDIRTLAPRDTGRTAPWEELGLRALITVPLVRDGALKAMLYVHEPRPRSWKRSDAAMARDVAERTWAAVARAQAEQSLRESEDHYRHTVELDPQISWTALPDGALNRVSGRWRDWTGTSGLGASWAEGLHADDRPSSFAAWAHSVATGEPYDIEHRITLHGGGFRWARSRAWPRRDEEGTIRLWYGSTEDIHEKKVAEEHQRLLINELNHRVKNSLATVQAIAFQTLKGDTPLAEARSRFEARLIALSRAHNLLTEQNWEGAALERVVRDSVEHLAGDCRFRIAGPAFWLAPRSALALALALHELGTNAAKYGALSVEAGIVDIAWSEEAGAFRLDWKESGGPAVAVPERRGFGSRLIEQGLGADLGGEARIAFEPDGLRCTIQAAVGEIAAREPKLG